MIGVEVEADAWAGALADCARLATEAAEAALSLLPHEGGGEETLTVLLTDDAAQRELNLRFRGKDSSTNVLSFPAPETAAPHLGDLSLAYETCAREASEQGKPLADHLRHLVVHGVLHLVGWDHQDDAEADEMEALERTILAGLGVPDPYARDEADA